MDDLQIDGWLTAWGESSFEYYSAPTSLADSPNGHYLPGSINILETKDFISIESENEVFLTFRAKWDIKAPSDFFQVLISVDKENYIPLCGDRSTLGTRTDNFQEPIYTGRQDDWIIEEINITEFAHRPVSLRFVLYSNGTDTRDGIYLDDIEIQSIDNEVTTSVEATDITSVFISPNPVSDVLQVQVKDWNSSQMNLQLVNSFGQSVFTSSSSDHQYINVAGFAPGLYLMQILNERQQVVFRKKIIIQR